MHTKFSPHRWINSLLKGGLLIVVGVILGAVPFGKVSEKYMDEIIINSIKFRELLHVIKTDYVENTNADSLTDSALENILSELDPHSIYIPKSEVKFTRAQLENSFEGIGVELALYADSLFVSSVASGSPAEQAGICTGDVILFVGKKQVTGANIHYNQISDLLRGPKGTSISLKIHRYGHSKPIDLEVVRDKIPSYSVDYAGMLSQDVGIVKISRFTHSTALELNNAIKELHQNGMKKLLLDLRDNSGGYVTAAVRVADIFLEDKKLIYYTKGRNAEHDTKSMSTDEGYFEKGPLVVLINERTASAAEIVTGALQDNDRALIVGRRSFGKGLVQAPVQLSDGSEVRLTISRYYTPSGRCIQKGYQRGKRQAYFKELEARQKGGELIEKDSIKVLGRPVFTTLKGRKILGGGGIIPDVFIAKDTACPEQLLQFLYDKMVFTYFGTEIYKRNVHQLKEKNLAQFILDFKIPLGEIEKFKLKASEILSREDKTRIEKSNTYIESQLKAIVAKCHWKSKGYFQTLIQTDKEIATAIKYFHHAELLANL